MISRKLELEGLNNTRDLGGMTGSDDRKIAGGRLIRSGHLFSASENDLKKLAENVHTVIDFRTKAERDEKPDPEIEGSSAVSLSVLTELTEGVTREEESDKAAFMRLSLDPELARSHMMNIYSGFPLTDAAKKAYSEFINILLENESGAVLWHCTAGKDRAGFAAVMIEEILGVSKEDIVADYLATNENIRDEVEQLRDLLGGSVDSSDEAIDYLFTAKQEYLETVYNVIEKEYGSFDEYLRQALGLDDDKLNRLREMYLE
ncbi:MAG: tyrosine-protein phosphatase [Ruminococcus sp.]|nr:tyrosine-protein phosphatase [Ruminococcus sp.]